MHARALLQAVMQHLDALQNHVIANVQRRTDNGEGLPYGEMSSDAYDLFMDEISLQQTARVQLALLEEIAAAALHHARHRVQVAHLLHPESPWALNPLTQL